MIVMIVMFFFWVVVRVRVQKSWVFVFTTNNKTYSKCLSLGLTYSIFSVVSPHLFVSSNPNGLLGCKCQRHINTVQSHPIKMGLPIYPFPKYKSVSRSTNVLVIPKLFIRGQIERGLGQCFWQFYR